MELEKALSQISEIHCHVLKTEIFRGYRSGPVAFTGFISLAGAAVQSVVLTPADMSAFVLFWVVIAGVCASISALDLCFGTAQVVPGDSKRRTFSVVTQFLPAVAAGALLTAFLMKGPPALQSIVPGIWVILFGLGIFSSLPYLPRTIAWIGGWYLVTGCWLLLVRDPGAMPSAWPLGCIFCIGQLAAGVLLHFSLERRVDHE